MGICVSVLYTCTMITAATASYKLPEPGNGLSMDIAPIPGMRPGQLHVVCPITYTNYHTICHTVYHAIAGKAHTDIHVNILNNRTRASIYPQSARVSLTLCHAVSCIMQVSTNLACVLLHAYLLLSGDESFGILTSRRPKSRRSTTFAQISALAAVTSQELKLEDPR